jgi:hypothetical protein
VFTRDAASSHKDGLGQERDAARLASAELILPLMQTAADKEASRKGALHVAIRNIHFGSMYAAAHLGKSPFPELVNDLIVEKARMMRPILPIVAIKINDKCATAYGYALPHSDLSNFALSLSATACTTQLRGTIPSLHYDVRC